MEHGNVVSNGLVALDAALRFGQRRLGAAIWEPAPGSEAAAELANAEVDRHGDPWDEAPPRTAYAAANLMMTGVLDDLASLRQMLGNPMPVIGPAVIARSVFEIAHGAWWLMEPGIGARRRTCRELILSLTSSRRALQVGTEVQEAGFPVGDEITDVLQQEGRVLQRINDLGLGSPSSGFRPTIEAEHADTATIGTAAMFKAALPVSFPATFVYRVYSAVTHGEFYGLMNFMAPGVTSEGSSMLHWHLDPEVLDQTIQLSLVAFRESCRHIGQVMGWGKLEQDLFEIAIGKIYNV